MGSDWRARWQYDGKPTFGAYLKVASQQLGFWPALGAVVVFVVGDFVLNRDPWAYLTFIVVALCLALPIGYAIWRRKIVG